MTKFTQNLALSVYSEVWHAGDELPDEEFYIYLKLISCHLGKALMNHLNEHKNWKLVLDFPPEMC